MTIAEWLDMRLPLAPPELAGQMRKTLGLDLERDAAELPNLCVSRGEQLLRAMLLENSDSRDRAGELLLVDALITYAFEAAIEDVETLDERARQAIARLSALAETSHR